jgi:hypothetical protein
MSCPGTDKTIDREVANPYEDAHIEIGEPGIKNPSHGLEDRQQPMSQTGSPAVVGFVPRPVALRSNLSIELPFSVRQ